MPGGRRLIDDVNLRRWAGVMVHRRLAGQQLEPVLVRGAGLGGVDGQDELALVRGGHVEAVEHHLEGCHGRVPELLGPGAHG